MFAADDTIVAISTPLGRAGLGVVRLSGPDAAAIALRLTGRQAQLEPRRATFARITPDRVSAADRLDRHTGGREFVVADQVVVTFFPGPHSATGDDVVELSAHGSPVVLDGILRAAMQHGARLAEPGEFTLRAFLNGKLDLVQAEAVADLIDAVTPLQARAAFDQLEGTLTRRIGEIESRLFDLTARLEASLDFPDEGYHFVERETAAREAVLIADDIDALLVNARRGRIVREGAQVAIVGTPNVGKSSVFNALLQANRAIVTPIPGTTRDLVSERADVRGMAVSLVDTAGIREAADVVEQEGISRTRQTLEVADLTLVLLDRSRRLNADDQELIELARARSVDHTAAETNGQLRSSRYLIVANKTDLDPAWVVNNVAPDAIEISAKTGTGVDALADRMAAALGAGEDRRDTPFVSNVRHIDLLSRARRAVGRAVDALSASNNVVSEEFILSDLQDASSALQEITGRRTTDDLLTHIFSRFCIGK